MRHGITILCLSVLCVAARLHADNTTQPAAIDWKPLISAMGDGGVLKDDVCTFTVPRNDLHVMIDGMEIPPGAGIASVFHFFKCPCGHFWIVGQFCCADYESDDVIDALRAGALIRIAGIGPMFTGDHPRIMIVRFHGEGDVETLVKLLKSAQEWMGENRTKPATQPSGN